MIRKQWVVGALACLACGSALANGFYVGGGAGLLEFKNKWSSTLTSSIFHGEEDATISTESKKGGDMNINGTVLAGYQWAFANHFALALEAFTNRSATELTDDSTMYGIQRDATLKSGWTYGLRVLPGYQVTPDTQVYGIVGYAHTSTTLDTNSAATQENIYLSIGSNSEHTQFDGYQLGLGTKIDLPQVSPHLAVRTDVIYTGYASKTITQNQPFAEAVLSDTYTLQPSTIEANVVLLYQFG